VRFRSLGGAGSAPPPIAASVAFDRHLTGAIAEFKPPPSQKAPVMTASTGTTATVIKDLMDEHVRLMGQVQQAQIELLRSSLAQQREVVAGAVGKIAEQINGQTADFQAMLGQITNDLG
jgi:hypothetical protein